MGCPPSVRTTLPKITGVKRVIAADVVALEQTDTHTVGPIGTSKAVGLM